MKTAKIENHGGIDVVAVPCFDGCMGCCFQGMDDCSPFSGECNADDRTDKQEVYFVRVDLSGYVKK